VNPTDCHLQFLDKQGWLLFAQIPVNPGSCRRNFTEKDLSIWLAAIVYLPVENYSDCIPQPAHEETHHFVCSMKNACVGFVVVSERIFIGQEPEVRKN
jgi:hypothetical protein